MPRLIQVPNMNMFVSAGSTTAPSRDGTTLGILLVAQSGVLSATVVAGLLCYIGVRCDYLFSLENILTSDEYTV